MCQGGEVLGLDAEAQTRLSLASKSFRRAGLSAEEGESVESFSHCDFQLVAECTHSHFAFPICRTVCRK